MEAHESMIELIANGPTVMAIQDMTRRAERFGIDNSHKQRLKRMNIDKSLKSMVEVKE